MKRSRLLFFCLGLLLVLPKTGISQWEMVLEQKDSWMYSINFLEEVGPPRLGFIGMWSSATGLPTLYRTSDYGKTWVNVTPQSLPNLISITSIAFKDSSTIWFSTTRGTSPFDSIYKSIDGGFTWKSVWISEKIIDIDYCKKTGLLFAVSEFGSWSSNDEGKTWQTIENANGQTEAYTNISFINDSVGVISAIGKKSLRTTDGGMTWDSVDFTRGYSLQAFAEKRGSIYLSPEFDIRSDGCWVSKDTGKTWQHFAPYVPSLSYCVGGQIVGNLCRLYIQDELGVYISTDTARTWSVLNDNNPPVTIGNVFGGKIFAKDNYLFVGQSPEPLYSDSLVGTIRPGEVWRYIGPIDTPQIFLESAVLSATLCTTADTLLQFIASNRCDGDKVILDTLYTSGSANFTITHNPIGREIVWDTLRVQYAPTDASEDTAFVHLRFKLKGNTFDTVMTIRGKGSSTKDSLSFLATLTKPSVTWEETTELRVSPDKAAANKGLAEIRFDVTLDADVLEPLTNYTTGIAGASIVMGAATPVGKLSRYGFVITGNNMTLDPAVSILNLPMHPYVSDTTMTTINVSTINLNPQDPDYERCTLSATGNDVPFQLNLMCGDSLLSRHLGGKPILALTSLTPNPANGVITIDFNSSIKGEATLQIIDDIGGLSFEEKLVVKLNRNTHEVSLSSLPSGTFFIRLQIGKDVVTGKFVKQ